MEVPHQRVADLFDARIGRALNPLSTASVIVFSLKSRK
jgi:hypothetical protein